jgi:hypothetical protein
MHQAQNRRAFYVRDLGHKRQSMYVQHNNEALSRNDFCCGKARCITNSECVFVALAIQYTNSRRHILIRGLSSSTTFFLLNVIIFE